MKRGDTIEQGEIGGVAWRRVYETKARERIVFDDDTPDLQITAAAFEDENGKPVVVPVEERGDFGPAVEQHHARSRTEGRREGAEEALRAALPALRDGGPTEQALAALADLVLERLP